MLGQAIYSKITCIPGLGNAAEPPEAHLNKEASLFATIIWTLVVAGDLVRGKRMSLALHVCLSVCTPLVAYLSEEELLGLLAML